jgi:hypothetical protein
VNQLLNRQISEAIGGDASPNGLACERSVRVAAATLGNAPRSDVSSTMVVGVLGPDDEDSFRQMVEAIAHENRLDATIKLRGGSFSVRFARDARCRT